MIKMKIKLTYLILPVIVLVAFASCASSKDMVYQGFENFVVSDVATNPKVNVDVKLFNPNKIGGTLKAMEFTVLVNDKPMGGGGIIEPIRIKRNTAFILPVECSTSLDKMGGLLAAGLKSYLGEEEVPVGLEGKITVQKLYFFHRTYQFKFTDELDIKKIMGSQTFSK